MITELERGLGSMLRRSDPSTHKGGKGGDTEALSSILTPNDESQYWADEANSAKRKDVRQRASAFWTALEPVANEFNKIETVQLSGKHETLELPKAKITERKRKR